VQIRTVGRCIGSRTEGYRPLEIQEGKSVPGGKTPMSSGSGRSWSGSRSSGPREFLKMVKVDLYPRRSTPLTPRPGQDFPRGATPVDFAYSVHTEVRHRCAERASTEAVPSDSFQRRHCEILTNPAPQAESGLADLRQTLVRGARSISG